MFWSDKRVMVTGGYGFLGTYVVEKLRERGCSRVSRMHSRGYDLRNREDVNRAFQDQDPNIVINLAAACGGIGANSENPGKFVYDNLMMGMNLMDEARMSGHVEKFVQIGSVCSYPSFSPCPIKEDDIWNGYPEPTNAPYGVAKRALMEMAQAYRKQYGLNAINLIPVNLYGPRDDFDPRRSHVVPALVRKCVDARNAGTPFHVWGTGTASREFLHVRDCAEAIVLAAERYDKPEPINLGTGKEILISDLVKAVADAAGFTGPIIWDATKPDGQMRRCLDVTRAEKEFGFKAQTDFAQGIKETVEWYERTQCVR